METVYRSLNYYDKMVRMFLDDNAERVKLLLNGTTYPKKSHSIDIPMEQLNFGAEFVSMIKGVGAMTFTVKVHDKITNRRMQKDCEVMGIDIGENRHADGELVTAYKVWYEGETTQQHTHKIIDRILMKDLAESPENRTYEFKPVYPQEAFDVYSDLGKKLAIFYGLLVGESDSASSCFLDIYKTLLDKLYMYFPGYHVGDVVNKARVKSVIDPFVYKKLDDELEVIKVSIDSKSSFMYYAQGKVSKKVKYTAAFYDNNIDKGE